MRAERSQESTAALQRTHAAGGLCAEGCCGVTYVSVLNSILFGYVGS